MQQIFIVSPNPLLSLDYWIQLTLAGKRGAADQNIADQSQTARMRK